MVLHTQSYSKKRGNHRSFAATERLTGDSGQPSFTDPPNPSKRRGKKQKVKRYIATDPDENFSQDDLTNVVESIEDPESGFAPDAYHPDRPTVPSSLECRHAQRSEPAVVDNSPAVGGAHQARQCSPEAAVQAVSN